MNYLSYKTESLRKEDVEKKWILIDAENKTLGRLCSQAAKIIRGKHKTNFTPHVDCGDNVVIINAAKVKLSGRKEENKEYVTYTGYPGGQRIKSSRVIREQHPTRLITHAIKGMLPKNKLGHKLEGNFYVYAGAEHDQAAQKPELLSLKY